MGEDLVKVLIWDVFVKAALKRLFALVPFLGWGPVGMIVTHYIFKFTDLLYEETKDFLKLEAIAFKNKIFESEFNKSSVGLKLIAKQYGIESKEYIDARENNSNRLVDVVVFRVQRS